MLKKITPSEYFEVDIKADMQKTSQKFMELKKIMQSLSCKFVHIYGTILGFESLLTLSFKTPNLTADIPSAEVFTSYLTSHRGHLLIENMIIQTHLLI